MKKRNDLITGIKSRSMKLSGLYLLGLLFVLGLSGCQDVIDLNVPDGAKQLVVEGWFTNDSTRARQVQLTWTSNYFDSSTPPPATGATLRVDDITNGDVFTFTETPVGSGIYVTDGLGVVGHSYSLNVVIDGIEYESAPQELSFAPEILDIYYTLEESNFGGDPYYQVFIDTYEPEGVGDFYRWRYFIDGEYYDIPFSLAFARDELVDGNDITEFDLLDAMRFYNNEEASLNDAGVPIDSDGDVIDNIAIIGKDSTHVLVEQSTISKEAFEFFNILLEQTAFIGGPFDPPPSPIKGNMIQVNDPDQYALGFFGVSAVELAEIIVVDNLR